MPSNPLLSIVTVSFNQKAFLRHAIESVLAQKTGDVEYIIVDPGSTDGSRDLITSYASQIDQIIFKPDQGPANGLNNGFAVAKGEVGYFLNSDDFLLPEGLSAMQKYWQSNTKANVLLCNGWMVDQAGLPLREMRARSTTLPHLIGPRGNMFQQGMSFRMSSFSECGGFNANIKLKKQ